MSSSANTDKKIAILHDNPPLPGKKFCLLSMISPESRQNHQGHGFKIHDMCETEEEGRMIAKVYSEMDDAFDVYLTRVGKWCPWILNPLEVQDVEYANKELTDLIRSHRMNRKQMDEHWKSEHEKNLQEIRKGATKEG